nr:hypothetical protein [uncultured archaeon]AQS32539.1 hypothetical protein [uncultured archaeon]AQS33091.1 hypothetical protein [uncultured archaeon]
MFVFIKYLEFEKDLKGKDLLSFVEVNSRGVRKIKLLII